MIYRYKDYVSDIKINGNEQFRFLLEFDLLNCDKGKSALVIMQNPSKATLDISDQTINRVLDLMHKFKYYKVYIVNLIPIYGTDSGSISDFAENERDIYSNNDKIIVDKINEVSKIFVAWGGRNKFSKTFYNQRVSSVYNLLNGKEVFCYNTNSDNTPLHPCRNQWKTDANEDDFKIYNFSQ